MKDSQLRVVHLVDGPKYIKVNNERFSTNSLATLLGV